MKQIVALAFTQKLNALQQSKACSRNQIYLFLSPAINLFKSSLVISLSRTTRSLRKLIVGFYRSGGCCEEILVPVKIASSDREIKNTKTMDLFSFRTSGQAEGSMSIPNFLSIHIGKFRLSLLGVIKGGMGIRWFDKPSVFKKPPLGFDTQATRPAKHRCKGQISLPLSTQLVLFDLKKSNLETPLSPSPFTLLGWASLDAPTPNKLLVGIVELSLEK